MVPDERNRRLPASRNPVDAMSLVAGAPVVEDMKSERRPAEMASDGVQQDPGVRGEGSIRRTGYGRNQCRCWFRHVSKAYRGEAPFGQVV